MKLLPLFYILNSEFVLHNVSSTDQKNNQLISLSLNEEIHILWEFTILLAQYYWVYYP